MEKLRNIYADGNIPLFDGYDLDREPEDPVSFFSDYQNSLRDYDVSLHTASPDSYMNQVYDNPAFQKRIDDELLSGKYGAVFTGVMSARTYLKLFQNDLEKLLLHYVEPLSALLSDKDTSETLGHYTRKLLQTSVHDCICGVSFGLVHDKSEHMYRAMHEELVCDLYEALGGLSQQLREGVYVYTPTGDSGHSWLTTNGYSYKIPPSGMGIYPVREILLQSSDDVLSEETLNTPHYECIEVMADGSLKIGDKVLGKIILRREHGDTYSSEPGEDIGVLLPSAQPVIRKTTQYQYQITYQARLQTDNLWVEAHVSVHIDDTPIIRLCVDLDSKGTDFSVVIQFDTGSKGELYAGMPYDSVIREAYDDDLLPRELPKEYRKILLGQREVGRVETYPFHGYVGLNKPSSKDEMICAKGLHSYRYNNEGLIEIDLRRSVEWLTRPDLNHRVGDAGPIMYEPGARCERRERHELAYIMVIDINSAEALSLNDRFQLEPILFEVKQSAGKRNMIELYKENIPISSFQRYDNAVWARLYNPLSKELTFAEHYRDDTDKITEKLAPKKIANVMIPCDTFNSDEGASDIRLLNIPQVRVGEDKSLPDEHVVRELEAKLISLKQESENLLQKELQQDGDIKLKTMHKRYIAERELYETELSLYYARMRLENNGITPFDQLFQENTALKTIADNLSDARIRRRMFDYVADALDF